MKEYYNTIKRYINDDKTENITDSVLVPEDLPVYDYGFLLEDVIKKLIWFLRADDNLTWLYNLSLMGSVGWEKKINRFKPLEDDTSLRFYLDGNKLNFVVTQHKVDLLEEAPYWMLFYSIFHRVVWTWCRILGWKYDKGTLLYNFVDSFVVTNEGDIHLPKFNKGWRLEVANKKPNKLEVKDFKISKL